jgi:hypothetical protein
MSWACPSSGSLFHASEQRVDGGPGLRLARVNALEPGVELRIDAFADRVEELSLELFAQAFSSPRREPGLPGRALEPRAVARERAEELVDAGAPALSDDILAGISLHDEGWRDFDSGAKRLQATPCTYSDDGVALKVDRKPISFLDIKAADFLDAWRTSIESAESAAPIAGLIVSGHFSRLGKFGVASGHYSDRDAALVHEFVTQEERRHERLSTLQRRGDREISYWTDVLQFFDVLSLYLCCGAEESVEFPQRIGPDGEAVRLQSEDEVLTLSPRIFETKAEFSLEAKTFPGNAVARLQWKVR